MSHARTTVRTAFVTAVTGLATTGSNVYQDWPNDIPETALPALRVMTGDEEIERLHGTEVRRDVEIVVEVLARAGTGLQTTVDNILAEVETAIAADDSLGINLQQCVPTAIDAPELDEDDQTTAMAAIRFLATYWGDLTSPSTIAT